MRRFFLLFMFLSSVGFLMISYFVYHDSASQGTAEAYSLVAPLPSLLIHAYYPPQENHFYWKPNETIYPSSVSKPSINAVSAIAYDISNDKLLYSSNLKERLPIASLTKIMTAIVALENMSPDESVTISTDAANVGEDSMGLTQNETLTLKELLYGLFLHSGNDAAEAIADSSKFGRDNFVFLMNKKAEDLGLTDTHFTNPTGLEGDGNQYSTVYDLLVMTKYGLEKQEFADASSTVEITLPQSSHHKEYYLFNETNLLTSYPGVKGVKTGFTYEAGMCLVTYLDYKGHKIIGVLLNSPSRRDEMKTLLDYSLKSQGITPPPHS